MRYNSKVIDWSLVSKVTEPDEALASLKTDLFVATVSDPKPANWDEKANLTCEETAADKTTGTCKIYHVLSESESVKNTNEKFKAPFNKLFEVNSMTAEYPANKEVLVLLTDTKLSKEEFGQKTFTLKSGAQEVATLTYKHRLIGKVDANDASSLSAAIAAASADSEKPKIKNSPIVHIKES